MKVCGCLLTLLILSLGLSARGDYQFTWHYVYPQLQRFQGSFEVTDAEMLPGASFSSDLFHTSISITSPENIIYRADDPVWSDTSGSFAPNSQLFMNLHDLSQSIT